MKNISAAIFQNSHFNSFTSLLSAGNGTIAEFTGLVPQGAEALLFLCDTKAIVAQVHLAKFGSRLVVIQKTSRNRLQHSGSDM